jgi:hypothetical protein
MGGAMPGTAAFAPAALLLPIFSFAAAAQAPASGWDYVKALAPGTEIRVAAGSSKPVAGKLESATDSGLVLTQAAGSRSFPQAEIRSVSIKKSRRLRNTLLGLGIGTAVGIGIGAGVGAKQASGCRGEILCGISVPIDAGVGGAIGLGAGTITGLAWPAGWRAVYVR